MQKELLKNSKLSSKEIQTIILALDRVAEETDLVLVAEETDLVETMMEMDLTHHLVEMEPLQLEMK
jgi:hypothetical protein